MGLAPAPDGHLWIIQWVPREDWRDAVTEVQLPDGRVTRQAEGGDAGLYKTELLLLSLELEEIVASQEFDPLVVGFLSTGDAYTTSRGPLGEPLIEILSIDVTLPE
jgi:hypothetical protein